MCFKSIKFDRFVLKIRSSDPEINYLTSIRCINFEILLLIPFTFFNIRYEIDDFLLRNIEDGAIVMKLTITQGMLLYCQYIYWTIIKASTCYQFLKFFNQELFIHHHSLTLAQIILNEKKQKAHKLICEIKQQSSPKLVKCECIILIST